VPVAAAPQSYTRAESLDRVPPAAHNSAPSSTPARAPGSRRRTTSN